MAKKSLQPPPSPSSESEEEDSSSSEEEQQPNTMPPPQNPTNNNEEVEDEESEDESDEESDDDEEEEDNSKKPHPSASTPSKPAAESGSGSESEEESDSDSEPGKLVIPISSRPMTEAPPEKSANGKALFQRIWAVDDEIAILEGMVRYQSEKGPLKLNPASIGDFHDFIKKNLSLEVTNTQLVDKLRRLKRKYRAVDARAESGKLTKFANAHDKTVYDLGKKIWAEDGKNEGKTNSVPLLVKGNSSALDSEMRFPLLKGEVNDMGKFRRHAEEALKTLDPAKADALEKRIRKQKMAEMKLHVTEMDLYKETFKLIMEGIGRASG